jgi:chromosome segregation ATPase
LEGTISVLREQLAKAETRADEALVDLRLERAGAREERQRLLDRLMQLDAELEEARAALAAATAARRPLAWLLPWRI